MRAILTAALLATGLGLATIPAEAKTGGCVRDGAVGAVAGHFVGHGHAVAGAAAGCAVGVHRRHAAERHQQQDQQPQPSQDTPAH